MFFTKVVHVYKTLSETQKYYNTRSEPKVRNEKIHFFSHDNIAIHSLHIIQRIHASFCLKIAYSNWIIHFTRFMTMRLFYSLNWKINPAIWTSFHSHSALGSAVDQCLREYVYIGVFQCYIQRRHVLKLGVTILKEWE